MRGPDKKCKVVEARPTDKTVVIVGDRAYVSRKKATSKSKVVCKDMSIPGISGTLTARQEWARRFLARSITGAYRAFSSASATSADLHGVSDEHHVAPADGNSHPYN